MRSLLNAKEAAEAISLMQQDTVEDIYTVELYSHSQHKFVGVCWTAITQDDETKAYWYPMCLDETKKMSAYSSEDLSEHLINMGETAVIGGITYICRYSDEIGTYFQPKKQISSALIKNIHQTLKQRAAEIGYKKC